MLNAPMRASSDAATVSLSTKAKNQAQQNVYFIGKEQSNLSGLPSPETVKWVEERSNCFYKTMNRCKVLL